MDTTTPSGFRYAPVSKFLVGVIGGGSMAAALLHGRTATLPPVWRAVVSSSTFASVGHTVMGTWLIYRMRIIERHYGSAKYAASICVYLSHHLGAAPGRCTAVPKLQDEWAVRARKSYMGYALLFAMLLQYQHIIPPATQFRVLGSTVSDKVYVYVAAAQMFFANTSIITPCLCGLASGFMYISNVGNMKKWRFPRWMRGTTTTPARPSPTPQRSSAIRPTNVPEPRPMDGLRQRTTASAARASTQPQSQSHADEEVPEDNVNALLAMFPDLSRDSVSSALLSARNDMNRAAEILLNMEE